MKPKIFISYRRDDSGGVTGRLYDSLELKLGSPALFKDVDNIPLGSNFLKEIHRAIDQCQIVLVVIGKFWTSIKDDQGKKRIFVENDFIKYEVEYAISRGKIIVPIFVNDGRAPKPSELPETIKDLAFYNGVTLRNDRWKSDFGDFFDELKDLFTKPDPSNISENSIGSKSRRVTPDPSTKKPINKPNTNKDVREEVYDNGKYIGAFNSKGERHGQGTYIWEKEPWNGDKFVGSWKNNDLHDGTYYYRTGDRYVGTWENGLKKNGKFYWNYGDSFDGEWRNDRMYRGVYHYKSGDRFIGTWLNGKKEEGAYYWERAPWKGDCFKGTWQNDEIYDGTYHFANGDKYVGTWVNGEKYNGTYYYNDGSTDTYKNGSKKWKLF